MKRISTREILRSTVRTPEGSLIPVRDVLFDDTLWRVEAITLEARNGFEPDRIVRWRAVDQEEWKQGTPAIRISEDSVEASPTVEDFGPVGEILDQRCRDRYGWKYELGGRLFYPPNRVDRSLLHDLERDPEPGLPGNLRSAREVIGYDLMDGDDRVGKVDDFMIRFDRGVIEELVVDTRCLLSSGVRVSVRPEEVKKICIAEQNCRLERSPAPTLREKIWERQLHTAKVMGGSQ